MKYKGFILFHRDAWEAWRIGDTGPTIKRTIKQALKAAIDDYYAPPKHELVGCGCIQRRVYK